MVHIMLEKPNGSIVEYLILKNEGSDTYSFVDSTNGLIYTNCFQSEEDVLKDFEKRKQNGEFVRLEKVPVIESDDDWVLQNFIRTCALARKQAYETKNEQDVEICKMYVNTFLKYAEKHHLNQSDSLYTRYLYTKCHALATCIGYEMSVLKKED